MMRFVAGLLALWALGLLSGCGTVGDGTAYTWGWYTLNPLTDKGASNLSFLLAGIGLTLWLSISAIVVSVVLGILLALSGLSRLRSLRLISRTYVEVFRAIPLLVLLLWVYYGLPMMTGLQFGAFAAGVLSLALSDAAFESEIFRAGIQSVAKGQREAAQTLGLSSRDTFRFVIFPQAIRTILPALGNQFVYVLKMSSLVSVIGLQELTRRANELNVTEYRPLEIYTALVVEYLLLILLTSWGVRRLERRMSSGVR
ncbi:MAG: amino acid ABC transporter permease [Ramlibacter sp.]|jgi:glutamine transport system permease protein|nr:amino acid ABC transporter permease [Ramlibacter sp.]